MKILRTGQKKKSFEVRCCQFFNLNTVIAEYYSIQQNLSPKNLRVPNRKQKWTLFVKKVIELKISLVARLRWIHCFVGKCHGGRRSDARMTVASGILDLLEPRDVVLTDKGLPEIKTVLAENGQNILLVTPPSIQNEPSTEEAAGSKHKLAKVRVLIEKTMQIIRSFRIVDEFTIDMLPHCYNIILMCCVLANLQKPVIQEKDVM